MAGKKKKSDKKDKKPKDTDSLTAVDRTFYEITINDLNNKLSRLRAHNAKIEELNETLTEKLQKLENDRIDITAHLNRQLAEKSDIIKEMNERLTELARVREKENSEAVQKLIELDDKFKSMNEQYTSEIKLLNSKLNSLEEFRVQRDDLFAKFDEQETALKEHIRMHKNVVLDMEQKSIIEKDQMKKDIHTKLLELSTEFNTLTDIRITDYTRQLYKENITLEKEMDKMIRAQVRFERKYNELENRNRELEKIFYNFDIEKNHLITTCQNQLKIIQDLTVKCEQLRDNNAKLKRYKESYENYLKKDICEQFSYRDMDKKLKIMGRRIEMVKGDKLKLIMIHQKHEDEIIQLRNTLKDVKLMVLGAIEKEKNPNENEAIKKTYRENLLNELVQILTSYTDESSIVPYAITPSSDSIYRPGIVGLTPKSCTSLLELFKKEARKIASAELILPVSKARTSIEQITPSPRIMEEENVFDIITRTVNVSHNVEELSRDASIDGKDESSSFDDKSKKQLKKGTKSMSEGSDENGFEVSDKERNQEFVEGEEIGIDDNDDDDDNYAKYFVY